MSALSGGSKTAVITHSQGGPDTQWALQFWPSTQTVTSSFIALSPDFTGIQLGSSNLSSICVGDLCQASIWQQSAGSKFYAALHAHNYAAAVPTTAIWTQFDGVVSPPQANAGLPGATVVSVQQLCPARLATHVTMTMDAAAFALALDALQHGGTADLNRVRSQVLSVCFRIAAKDMKLSVADQIEGALDDAINGFLYVTAQTMAVVLLTVVTGSAHRGSHRNLQLWRTRYHPVVRSNSLMFLE
jgi:triacylglycerol lipase